MKFRLVEDFDDLLLEVRKPAIEPGSDLETSLIYDIENTDIPYMQLVKKYRLNTEQAIYTLIDRLNLHPIPRPQRSALIKPGSELEKAIIDDLIHTDKSYTQIGKEYGIGASIVYNFAQRKNLGANKPKRRQKMHVYFNTLEAADVRNVGIKGINATMKFLPSIYIGEYSVGIMNSMYEYIRNKYLNGKPTTAGIIEFYLKIASNEISLNTLITEMKAQSSPATQGHPANFDYRFITVSTEELATVDFHSANYYQLAKDILTFLSRKDSNSKDFDTVYKDLKAAAAKLDPKTKDGNDRIDTYISNNLEKIAHNIYSKKGDVIEATNYINGIPYETSFNVSSPQDVASCMSHYKGYLLYGFMNKTSDIVYIGISTTAESRGNHYTEENRLLIRKAFEDNIIKKFIIFKSNLPIQSRSVNTKLIYALEVYFAEQLFKTYPATYPKALNKDKPGQNSSGIIASQKKMDLDTYLSEQDKLLSGKEYHSAVKEITGLHPSNFNYYDYVKEYVATHNIDLSFEDKKNLFSGLRGSQKELLWDHCSSESEYRKLIPRNHGKEKIQEYVNAWKNYRIKNNLPITEELDDDIDMEYFI